MDTESNGIDGYDLFDRPTLVDGRNHKNHWLNRANDLYASAGAIWFAMRSGNNETITHELNLGQDFSMSVACKPVYHMICGLSLEVVMKAVIVSRGGTVPEKHFLNDLADLIGIKRNENERKMLRFYEA
ncbi:MULTISPECIES: hypothetical protein [unclassified Pseudomonas]|uniref:hypothetical protein n=1 Tax=unclassified Pseudomonas TaxID=196821 RepID=UPI00027074D9|nr:MULTISPECIES: hypothetical protein [unclassified Pseudomonas]EJM89840.1 hypothetical protein PMI33_02118 [Pseudomonas sp. GM67]